MYMNFCVGDAVRIRDWEDMVREYGVDAYGDINLGHSVSFVRNMRALCGRESTVTRVDADGYHVELSDRETRRWSIITSMLERVEEYEVDNSSLDEFLNAYL